MLIPTHFKKTCEVQARRTQRTLPSRVVYGLTRSFTQHLLLLLLSLLVAVCFGASLLLCKPPRECVLTCTLPSVARHDAAMPRSSGTQSMMVDHVENKRGKEW